MSPIVTPITRRREPGRGQRHQMSMSAVGCLATVLLAGLTGCQPAEKFAPACPQLGLLSDAADLTRFRPGGRDVTDMVLDGRITAVPARCSAGEGGTVQARLTVTMDLTRGPAAPARGLTVPYFVAVTEGERVLDKQEYALAVAFPANTDKLAVSGQEVTLNFPVSAQKSAAAYKIFVGFVLDETELANNRRRGAR